MSVTEPGTRKLSEVARHVVVPTGIVSTGYPAVAAKCLDLGIVHDDWQQGLGRLALGKRSDGKYAATVGGVVLSIPRQVGKTFTIGSIVFALCILFPRLTVLWTAHHTRTTDETFGSMVGLSHRRKVAPHVADRRKANGQQAIVFRNGSRILFGAREHGFGRGFAEVDVEVFDEAQILSARALDDMVPATNQSKHPAGALLFYMGTPPAPGNPSEVFTGKRERALEGKTADQVYVELGADPDADADDETQWAKANPSYPLRTPRESMLRMRENTGSDEAYLREALGVWSKDAGKVTALDHVAWAASAGSLPPITRPVFGVATGPDAAWCAIAAAWLAADGTIWTAITGRGDRLDYRTGTEWVTARLRELTNRHGGSVVLDVASRGLWPDGVKPSLDVQAQAHNAFADRVLTGGVRHGNEGAMNTAVRSARWKTSGESRSFERKGDIDISPLRAAALAVHELTTKATAEPRYYGTSTEEFTL